MSHLKSNWFGSEDVILVDVVKERLQWQMMISFGGVLLLFLRLSFCLSASKSEGVGDAKPTNKITVVSKCCPVDSVLVETSLGQRECQRRTEALAEARGQARWSPVFFDLATGHEVMRPATYELRSGKPACNVDAGEVMYPVYHHENTLDDMMLLQNGSLAHQLVHQGQKQSEQVLFPPSKYCLEDMVAKYNLTAAAAAGEQEPANKDESLAAIEFAYICVNMNVSIP